MRSQRLTAFAMMVLAAPGIAGCSIVPRSGPTASAVVAEASKLLPYKIVPLTGSVLDTLARFEPQGLAGVFTDRRTPANLTFGIGDVVSVSVFEAAAGGLFIPSEAGVRPGNFVQLPDQAVDNDGNITVPYAGVIRAAGRTNVQVQNDVVARIKNRAIDPQVVVSLSSQRTSLVSVLGEVNNPIRFPAAAAGANDRITDAITRAGGIKGQGYETWVVLERGSKRATVPFENLIMDAANNIYVQPNDRIYVYREQQKFIAFGASGQQGEFTFDAWRINLAEAVAKAGGLLDSQADAAAVFVYRREPAAVAEALGATLPPQGGDTVPVIFQVDLSDPAGYFLATRMMIRNQDVLFVANAKEVELNKLFVLLNLVTGTAANTIDTVNIGYAVRANILGR